MSDGINHQRSSMGSLSDCNNSSLSCSESTNENVSSVEPCILWVCILRNGILLVKATAENKGPKIVGLARSLLQRKVTTGWDTISDTNGPLAKYRGGYKGLKLHLLEETDGDEILVWTFACVYDSRLVRKEMAQAFVEQKLLVMTEGMRQVDNSWRNGGHLACQEEFGPILRQRLDEMNYQSGVASVDDGLTLSSEAVKNNVAVLQRYQEKGVNTGEQVHQDASHDSRDGTGKVSSSYAIERERKPPSLFCRFKGRESHSWQKPDENKHETSAPPDHVYIPTEDLVTKKHSIRPTRLFSVFCTATCLIVGAAIFVSHQLRGRPKILASLLSFEPISPSQCYATSVLAAMVGVTILLLSYQMMAGKDALFSRSSRGG